MSDLYRITEDATIAEGDVAIVLPKNEDDVFTIVVPGVSRSKEVDPDHNQRCLIAMALVKLAYQPDLMEAAINDVGAQIEDVVSDRVLN